jgi:hypothetical protein
MALLRERRERKKIGFCMRAAWEGRDHGGSVSAVAGFAAGGAGGTAAEGVGAAANAGGAADVKKGSEAEPGSGGSGAVVAAPCRRTEQNSDNPASSNGARQIAFHT